MAAVNMGPIDWSLDRADDGNRTYNVTYLVKCDSANDGPKTALACPGLPVAGSAYTFGGGAETDAWAWATAYASVKRHQPKGGGREKYYAVSYKFATKTRDQSKCADAEVEDPLLEPQKVSGSSVAYTKEAEFDATGAPLTNSAFERLRGPIVEFDHHRHRIRIEQNVSDLELDLCCSMIDTLNDATLWGMMARSVKLSGFSWEKKYHGACSTYYTRTFEFDVSTVLNDSGIPIPGHDRVALDEGTTCLRGDWNTAGTAWVLDGSPSAANPADFVRFHDQKGNVAKVVLDGAGEPITDPADAGGIPVEYYPESNFLLLSIPASL
jgi:hypothetical protein